MKNLKTIEGLFKEIEYLQKKADLLDYILKYYDKETMSFMIPETINTSKFSEKIKSQLKVSPREKLNQKINECLDYNEKEYLINWERL